MSPEGEPAAVDLGEYRGRRALEAKRDADRQRKRDQAEQRTRDRLSAAPDAEHFGAVTPALLAKLGSVPTTVNRGSLVAVGVAHHAEMGAGDEHSTPIVDIGARLRLGKATVRKATADLVAAGMLTRQNFPRRGPVLTPAKYSRGPSWPPRIAADRSKPKPLRPATGRSTPETLRPTTGRSKQEALRPTTALPAQAHHGPDRSGPPRAGSRREIYETPGDSLAANGEPPAEPTPPLTDAERAQVADRIAAARRQLDGTAP